MEMVAQILAPSHLQAAEGLSHLQRAAMFLKAGDYRHAVEACQAEVREIPSVRSYIFLTYVYHALDGYLAHLANTDQWVRVEHLYINLATGRAEDLVDPPDVLARIAKELIQQAVQRQADVTGAMASRLDEGSAKQMWQEQSVWRKARPTDWWSGVPPEWQW
ncbi:MAG: exported protein of unknown function [Nitrospira sp.]|jgi:hypothetical protein|nr:exported protein of unknown function [Nitrospira sp.]